MNTWVIVIAASIGILWGFQLMASGEAILGLGVIVGSAWFANSRT